MTYTILIVDDDPNQQRIAEHIIGEKLGYETVVVDNGQKAIDILTSERRLHLHLVLLDMAMPEVSGLDVLHRVKSIKNVPPIIVRTAHDDVDIAVEAMKAGAIDFVKKQDGIQRLQACIQNALRLNELSDELQRLKRSIGSQVAFSDIIGNSPNFQKTIELGKKVSHSNIPVFIEGESGVGKELLAHAIHNNSDRTDKPFVAVNCGAIPENLVESILFGHEKGAFTGAIAKNIGKFREADGGTLFLDEVGELSPHIQVKLLRALQENEVESVGGKKPVKIDIRIISATNQDITAAVEKGEFREDLYYRLHVFPIHIPPLRERGEDICPMVEYYCKRFAVSEGKRITGVTEKAKELLKSYHWPGNVRELKNMVFRAVVLCEDEMLDVIDFPQIVKKSLPGDSLHHARVLNPNDVIVHALSDSGHFRSLNEVEGDIIKSALHFYKGHMSEIARRLGIGRSTLYRKLSELGVDAPSDGSD